MRADGKVSFKPAIHAAVFIVQIAHNNAVHVFNVAVVNLVIDLLSQFRNHVKNFCGVQSLNMFGQRMIFNGFVFIQNTGRLLAGQR